MILTRSQADQKGDRKAVNQSQISENPLVTFYEQYGQGLKNIGINDSHVLSERKHSDVTEIHSKPIEIKQFEQRGLPKVGSKP